MKILKNRTGISRWLSAITFKDICAISLFLWCYAIIIFAFPHTFPRFAEACRDFGLELARFGADFINSLFGTDLAVPDSALTVRSEWIRQIKVPTVSSERWQAFWTAFADKQNFIAWLQSLVPKVRLGAYLLMIIVPVIAIVVVLYNKSFTTYKPRIKRSKPLLAFDAIREYVLRPTWQVVKDFVGFLNENSAYKVAYFLTLFFAANGATVVLEALGWYFYILSTFSLSKIYMTIYKLFVDIVPAMLFVPFPVYFVSGIAIFDRVRIKRGYAVLEHHEMMNRGFIASLPLVIFMWGTMGSKKTTLLVDMALSYSAYFRHKAYELLIECDLLYPEFPWLRFEREIRDRMKLSKGDPDRVYNLRSAECFVRSLESAYTDDAFDLWGYNGKQTSADGLSENRLFEVLRDYAQLYFIYVISSSLIISNFSIREDSELYDLGNFPQWSFDFFRKDPASSAACSRYSHILDQDLLRIARKIIRDNRDTDGFEFGIVCITEIGKERGNQIDNRKYKADDDVANPTNDGFNKMLKLCRHFATVRHFPFVTFLLDDQRPESLGADARELCQLVRVEDCSDKRCAEPMRFVDDYIHDWLFARWAARYQKFRFYRADSTLTMNAYKGFFAWIHKRYVTAHNLFDYFKAELALERGTREGGQQLHPYYISTNKVYKDRFATDAFAGLVDVRVERSNAGILDLKTYCTTVASPKELMSSNSYLIQELTVMLCIMTDRGNL